jgi:hypothetical protein
MSNTLQGALIVGHQLRRDHRAVLVDDRDVVVLLADVDTDEQTSHEASPW